MKVLLRKIVSTHDRVRTNEIIGECLNKLEVGNPIVIIGEPLDKTLGADYHREFTSTPIRKIEGNKYFTSNSVYEIVELGEQQVS